MDKEIYKTINKDGFFIPPNHPEGGGDLNPLEI
jgi:hypothetical protein